jgi:TPR repeat protein
MSLELIQYQNANQSYEEVIKNFVVRQKEFERIIDDIRTTKDGSSFQHYVFVGRRGSGKSTLLRRIQAEIALDEKLHKKYIAINLGEEQTGVYKLYDLWDYVIRDLNTVGYNITQLDFRQYKNDMKAYTKALHGQVITALQAHKKKMILLVDNIDRVLDTRGSEEDASLLRELLMNFKDIRIIGGSTVMSEHFWKYDMPFYQFFSIKKLEALSLNEVEQLLEHWSKIKQLPEILDLLKKYPGKLQSIRMLTDGMPRTMLIFVDMLINRPNQHGYNYLQLIVDRATPIYQERLSILSPAQNKVLTELAFFWEAATVEQLIPKCNMDGKTISALLHQLTQSRYVEKIKGSTKNLLYRLEERFFNLWFNMSQGSPQQRQEAKALTDFLEKWYDDAELKNLCSELVDSLKGGALKQDYAESMSLALLNSKKINKADRQNLYLAVSKSGLVEAKKLGEAKKYIENFDEAIKSAIAEKNYQNIIDLLFVSTIEDSRKNALLVWCYNNLGNVKVAKKYLLDIEEGDGEVLFYLAILYDDQGKETEAEKYYLLAIENGIFESLNNLAILYKNQGKEKDAERYFLLAIEKGDINSLFNLALIYDNQGNEKDAEKYYLLSIEKGGAKSLNNLGLIYDNQGNEKDAEKYYLLSIEKGNVESLNNLAILYKNQGKEKDAEKYYLLAIEKGDIGALNNLASLYKKLGKEEDAEKYFLLAIEKGNIDALHNLATLYEDQGREKDSEKYYLLAIEHGVVDSLLNLALFYENQDKVNDAEKYYLLAIEKKDIDSLFNLASLYENQGKDNNAEKYYLLAIEKGDIDSLFNLALLYENQGKDNNAEKYYLLAVEKGDVKALNNLLINNYEENKKTKVKNLINGLDAEMLKLFTENNYETSSIIYLYLGEMDKFKEMSDLYLNQLDNIVSEYFILNLLLHKQSNWVFNYFQTNQAAKEQYRPLYYATLILKADQEQELLRMPPELNENVTDIVNSIKEKQEYYYGKG